MAKVVLLDAGPLGMASHPRPANSIIAHNKSLDADAILAGQAATFATGTMVIATGNPRHLARFVAAEHWSDIEP